MTIRSQFRQLIIVSALCFSACSEMKKVDEMKDSTSEMNTTTKELRDKTGDMKNGLDKMSGKTESMATDTGEMRRTMAGLDSKMTQGDTAGLRRAFAAQMQESKTLQGRVGDAGLYMMAFEFQVFGAAADDETKALREVLYQQAMLEFFLKLDEIAPKKYDVEPSAVSAFNAVAFALHKTNRHQSADAEFGRPVSFYDLIVHAMRLKPLIDKGEVVLPEGPHYIKEILARPDRVRQLLQTRYNMFTYGLLGLTTNLCDSSKPIQLWKILMDVDIDLTEKTRGAAGLAYIYEEVLQPAARTTEDMVALGLKPQFSRMTKIALGGMKIKFRSADDSGISVKGVARESAIQNLWLRYTKP